MGMFQAEPHKIQDWLKTPIPKLIYSLCYYSSNKQNDCLPSFQLWKENSESEKFYSVPAWKMMQAIA